MSLFQQVALGFHVFDMMLFVLFRYVWKNDAQATRWLAWAGVMGYLSIHPWAGML